MTKLLLFALLGVVVYLILRNLGRRRQGSKSSNRPVQDMVACAQCGVNLPESESLKSGAQYYCCEQHRELGPLERRR